MKTASVKWNGTLLKTKQKKNKQNLQTNKKQTNKTKKKLITKQIVDIFVVYILSSKFVKLWD